MKKNIIIIFAIVLVLLLFFAFRDNENNKEVDNKQASIFTETMKISQNYLDLRIKTDEILTKAKDYKNYEDWNKDLTVAINNWQRLAEQADALQGQVKDYDQEKTSFQFVSPAYAYSAQEISNVYDAAPAGKKIATLAKYLGVDARRAFKILKNDQEFVKADAWNEAGDTFQKLETSAVVIKDGCKVAGFVGGVIISGGAAGFAGASTLTQTALVVNGADLILEVSDDTATIALGNDNKVSGIIGTVRSVTEPAASILAITDMPGNLASKFDKFNAVMFGADQLRSVVQEGKIIGIDISSSGKVKASALTKKEAKDWLKEKNNNELSSDAKDIITALDKLDFSDDENNEDNNQENGKDIEEGSKTSGHYGAHKVYSKNGKTYVTIVNPKEATFQQGQGRLWEAEVKNYDSQKQGRPVCNWKFYINGKEVRHMDKTCKFLTDLGSNYGALKVEVTVNFTKTSYKLASNGNKSGENLKRKKVTEVTDTIVVDRNYEIIPTPKDNYHK